MKLVNGDVLWLALALLVLKNFLPCSHQDIFMSGNTKNTKEKLYLRHVIYMED